MTNAKLLYQKYTSKIIKAGALVDNIKITLANWNEAESISENLGHLQEKNMYGRASRKRIQDMLRLFRDRYLENKSTRLALTKYVDAKLSDESLRFILYYHAAKSDILLHDIAQYLNNIFSHQTIAVGTDDFVKVLKNWNEEGKMTGHWSDVTINRVGRNVATTLRDFGILQGAANKRLAAISLPTATFAHIAFIIHSKNPSGIGALQHPDWNLFFQTTPAVERLFLEAHQHGLLAYYAAGSTIRLTFPVDNLEEYADVILQRAP